MPKALHNRREVLKKLRDKDVVHTQSAEIDRSSLPTAMVATPVSSKSRHRKGDNVPMAVIELVREKTVTSEANHNAG